MKKNHASPKIKLHPILPELWSMLKITKALLVIILLLKFHLQELQPNSDTCKKDRSLTDNNSNNYNSKTSRWILLPIPKIMYRVANKPAISAHIEKCSQYKRLAMSAYSQRTATVINYGAIVESKSPKNSNKTAFHNISVRILLRN